MAGTDGQTKQNEGSIVEASVADNPDGGGIFRCHICGLEEHYDYFGQKPAFLKKIIFTEDSYIMRNPFTPPRQNDFLLLGSKCSCCHNPVCQFQKCSIFYSRRYCMTCAKECCDSFPGAIQNKIKNA